MSSMWKWLRSCTKTEQLHFTWRFSFWYLLWRKMFLNKLTIHCICWGYFLTELSLKRLKRQELSYLPLRNLKTSIKLLNLLNTMKYQNIAIADKQFQYRMEAITKDLEALFKKKQERTYHNDPSDGWWLHHFPSYFRFLLGLGPFFRRLPCHSCIWILERRNTLHSSPS